MTKYVAYVNGNIPVDKNSFTAEAEDFIFDSAKELEETVLRWYEHGEIDNDDEVKIYKISEGQVGSIQPTFSIKK